MKKSSLKNSILLTLIALALWSIGSWWHYSCNIKNTCGNTQILASNQAPTSNKDQTSKSNLEPAQVTDADSDGLSDTEEARLGTDPLLIDTDEDGIPDNEEVGVNLDSPLDSDEDNIIDALDLDDDNDGISTLIEEKIGTSSLHADTDGDGILDLIEVGQYFDTPLDTDSDGIINALDTDDDDDGIDTNIETVLGTNYLLLDTDGDGLSDSKEVGAITDKPIDSDADGIIDALDTEDELDQDNDGLSDKLEAKLNTNPTMADTDNDGINDAVEVGENTSEPLDSDLDGIIDALDTIDDRDTDNDGLTDSQEIKLGSNPKEIDSDNDGINDIEEIGKNIDDPLDTDADGILNIIDKDDDNDTLSTRYEIRIGTNPLSDDTDGDGLKDNIEVKDDSSNVLLDTDNDKKINAVDADDDNDNIPTAVELTLGTNPLISDIENKVTPDVTEAGSNTDKPIDRDVVDDQIDALDVNTEKLTPPKSEIVTLEKTKAENELDLEFLGPAAARSIQPSRLYFPYLSAEPVINDTISNYFTSIVEWLKQNPENNISLIGHTDNVGSKQSNLALGIRRVMMVRELLIQLDAPINQIDVISRGESQPIADNSTKRGQLKNRRVEITPM